MLDSLVLRSAASSATVRSSSSADVTGTAVCWDDTHKPYTVLSPKRVAKVAVKVVGSGASTGDAKPYFNKSDRYSQPLMCPNTATRARFQAIRCHSSQPATTEPRLRGVPAESLLSCRTSPS